MVYRIVVLFTCLLLVAPASAQDDPIAAMSLEQRVAQMFMVTLHGSVMNGAASAFLQRWHPGGVVLFTANAGTPEQVTRLTNDFQQTITEAGGPPLFIAVDQEGNVVARLTDGFTVFPNPLLTTAAGEEMAYRVGQATAEELSAVGINMNLAPVADLETNRDNPIIFRRSYGSHPQITGNIIAQIVRGTQSLNVLATAKHFPGHGETDEDSHGTLPVLDISRERIENLEVAPFRSAVDAGVAAVMVAHIWFPALDAEETPASLSYNVVTGLLREELGFDGLVMTDALDMSAIDMRTPFNEAMVKAVQAGVDLLAMGPSIGMEQAEGAIQRVIQAVQNGEISEQRINESVRRILRAKQQFGILDWKPLDPDTARERVRFDEHEALIEELFRQGVTVAYDHNNLVPLVPGRKNVIVFLATRYQIQNECQQYDPNIRWVGVGDQPSGDEIGWAQGAALESDVTVVFTQNAVFIPEQQALVNALPPEKTVAISLWSPYDWRAYPQVGAYMLTYSPARPAVPAACAILFGAQPAHGQLAITLSLNLQAGSRAN